MRTLLFLLIAATAASAANLSITASNVNTISGDQVQGVVSYGSSARGDLVYLTSGRWALADSNNDMGASSLGIIVTPAVASAKPAVVQVGGVIDIGATCSIGVAYVASATQGKIQPIDDVNSDPQQYLAVVGIGETTNNINLILKATSILMPSS